MQLLLCVLLLAAALAPCAAHRARLDGSHRRGRLRFHETAEYRSNVYESLASLPPHVRQRATFLSIDQVIEAPVAAPPAAPRLPRCIKPRALSKALASAINAAFFGSGGAADAHTANASVDTTYTQVFSSCRYSSLISYAGSKRIREQLVAAAEADAPAALCGALPGYCESLQPGKQASASSRHTSSSSSNTSTSTSSSASSSSSSSEADYLLVSTTGDASPALPPVLDFKCKKFHFRQLLDHFTAKSFDVPADSAEAAAAAGSPGVAPLAASRRLLQQQWRRWWRPTGQQQQQQQQQGPQPDEPATFTQVYWVCGDAWPRTKQEQAATGHVMVFLGNESPLGVPSQPIVFESARRLGALVLLVEHRYYGDSHPFPPAEGKRVPTDKLKWLRMDQVIEDTASVVQHVRRQWGVPAAVPSVVIGGSYGGMLAAYHRVVRPDVFHAAIASSAPVTYIVGTKMWAKTANRYHEYIDAAVDMASGGHACSATIRRGLAELLQLGRTPEGRQQLARAFQMCNASAALPSERAVMALQGAVIGSYQGFAQVNNQPPMLGELALACDVLARARAAGASALAALAAVEAYWARSSSADWCWDWAWDGDTDLFAGGDEDPDGVASSYMYQCCSEATVVSSELPARGGSAHTLNPEDIPVLADEVTRQCRHIFGPELPPLRGPPFARHILRELRRVGGVVFTAGTADGWSGGSLGLQPGRFVPSSRPSGASGLTSAAADDNDGGDDGDDDAGLHGCLDGADLLAYLQEDGDASRSRNASSAAPRASARDACGLAYVAYERASHCTDTHAFAWHMPGQPRAWRRQRARAVDYAARFMAAWRRTAGLTLQG